MFSFIVDVDSHRRGQTSRSVFGDKTETNSDFKALMYRYSYFLDFTHRRWIIFHFTYLNNHYFDIALCEVLNGVNL